MDFLTSMKIASSALAANRKRMGAISSNIANANTLKTPEGGPYRKKIVVFGAEPARESFSDILEGELDAQAQSVHATEVISDNAPPRLKYEPNNPHADENGMVAYPDINVMTEMADLISASRSYEANIQAINTSKSMLMKALDIGKY